MTDAAKPVSSTAVTETKQEPTPTVVEKPFVFDDKVFEQRLKAQEDYLRPFAGQKGMNPYFQINEIGILRALAKKPESRTKEVFNKAASFVQKPPQVSAIVEEPVSTKPVPTLGHPPQQGV